MLMERFLAKLVCGKGYFEAVSPVGGGADVPAIVAPDAGRAVPAPKGRSALPFKCTGGAAIIAGGLTSAVIAYHATQPLAWMVAYLVLVVGVVQYLLGAGQAQLSAKEPSFAVVSGQWVLLNFGHACIIGGTLAGRFAWVIAGTLLYDAAMVWFGLSVRGGALRVRLIGYRVLVLAMFASSLVGVVLSTVGK